MRDAMTPQSFSDIATAITWANYVTGNDGLHDDDSKFDAWVTCIDKGEYKTPHYNIMRRLDPDYIIDYLVYFPAPLVERAEIQEL